MLGSDLLYTALNVTTITDLLDLYMTIPALFSESLIPQDFTGNKSINFYMSTPFNAAINIPEYTYSINCRANSYEDSRDIASAVVTEINRVQYTGYYIVVSVLETIRPMDDTDNYNTPVEAIIKTR